MRDSEKRLIFIILLVGVVVIGGLLIWKKNRKQPIVEAEPENEVEEYVQVLSDGSKLNISEEMSKIKYIDGLEIKNIQFKETGGITKLIADVENKTGNATKEKMVIIQVLDKEGQEITRIRCFIDPIEAGRSTQINAGVSVDVANAYDFKVINP